MVALALMVSCMPSAYTISASEAFGDGTEDIFTDGEITSEPAAEESTPDVSSADQEETEQAQQSTLTYENDSVKVTAEALEDGALPQNTALKADGVNENSSVSYDTVSQKLSAAATDKGSSLRGFFAYDVYFADGDGNRVEPNGRVRVTFEYKTPAAPELTDAASTSVTVEKLHYNSSTGDTDVNTLQANEDLKVLNVNEGKQIQTLQVETGNAAVFAVMWDSPETADVEAEAVSGNEDEVSIASEELTDGMDISDEPEQDAAETPAAENPEVTPDAEPSEAPAENPDAEPTEAPAENPDVVEEPAEDIASPDEVPAADENGETSLIEVLGDDTNLRVSPSIEAEVLATVNAGTQLTLLDTVTAEDGATWYKVSWEGTEAYIRSDMAQVVDSSDEAEEVEDVQESEEVSYSKTVGDVVVTATAASGVLPEDAQFVVNPIEKDSDQYTDVADRLEKKVENEDYSIAGFLAYDIYFQDSEGKKINPEDGKVKVSMEYQNATAPEEVKESDAVQMDAEEEEASQENTEAKELSISVMHFVEENGEVTSVVDMTKENSATVETNEAGEVQKAEFETESFSTFTITWTQMKKSDNGEISIDVKYVDDKGEDISEKVTNPIEIKASKGTAIKLEDYEPYISGYGFTKAQIGDATYSETAATLKYIKATFGNTPSDSKVYQYSNDAQTWETYNTEPTIYLVYTATGLSIKDELESTGNLVPALNETLKKAVTDKTVKYTWYKSINDGEFTEVNRIKVTGETYNIETNDEGLDCLNVAMDEGTLSDTQTSVKYKVGLKIGDQEEIYSGEYNVRYYGELHNGGFETPVLSKNAGSNWQFSNENYKAQGGVWQTTGTTDNKADYYKYQDPDGADIEIVTAKEDLTGYAWNGNACDARGVANTGQFAELNCQAAGALYQDVITYQGEKLNFWLSHRARGLNKDNTPEYDTMYVVIMPTSEAKNYDTQEKLVNMINRHKDSAEGSVDTPYGEKGKKIICNNEEGIFIERVTSNDQSWNSITEEGKYSAKSSMTRFFFVAGATASNDSTVGNFLDNVGFSQKLPPADSGKFTLKIEKKFTGGFEPTSDLEEKMTFTIHALHQDGTEITGNERVPLNGQSFKLEELKQEDGSYSITLRDNDIDANKKYIYSVEETDAEVNAYDLATTQTVSGGTVQPNKTSTLIGEKDSVTFTITNKYTKINLSSIMTYNKTAKVKDWDQRTYEITIDAASTSSSTTSSTTTSTADIMLVLDVSGSMDEILSSESHDEYEFRGKNTKKIRDGLDPRKTYYVRQPGGTSYEAMSAKRVGWSIISPKHEWYIGNRKASDCEEILDICEKSTVTTSITRLDALKDAVKQFITSTAEKSGNSNIGITAFSSEHDTSKCNGWTKQLSNAKNNEQDLKKFVDSLKAGGGTKPAIGLKRAKEELSNATNPKYVILFTDGAPTGNKTDNEWDNDAKTNAETAAQQLKEAGYTVYTVGFGLNENTQKFLAGDDQNPNEYPENASSGCAKNANNVEDLNKIFREINSSITNNLDIVGATITDVIDPRFEIVNPADGTVSEDENGRQQVTWTNQTIYNPNKEGNPRSWNRTITVRAKDAFIGGNNIPTNVSPDSKISLGEYESAILPQPTVNVKSDLVVNNKEVTIFYGDQIPTDEAVVNELFNKAEPEGYVTQLDGKRKLVTYTIGSDGKNLKNAEGNLVNPNDFTLTWYSDQACTKEIADLANVNPSADSTQYYYLKVTYNNLGKATPDSNAHTTKDGTTYISGDPSGTTGTGSITAYNSNDSNKKYGVYTVKVISGQIQITKKLVKNENNDPFVVTENDGQKFTFKVTKLKDESGTIKTDEAGNPLLDTTFGTNASKEVIVTIPKGESQVSLTEYAELQNLPRGIYEVEEINVPSFELTNAEAANETDCYSTSESLKVRVSLGYSKAGANVINNKYKHIGGGQLGVAVYTNKLVTADLKLKKVDADNMDILLRGAEFELEMWTASENSWMPVEGRNKFEVNKEENLTALLPGRYKLTETKAPDKHALLGSSIYFKVESGKVLLTNEDGTPANNESSKMWTLANEDNGGQVLTIKNTEIYSLPNSGGPGTYGFTISGVAILATALLLFINNKRREEEAKRS